MRQVGICGEVFDRHLGRGSAIRLERSFNDLWKRGGLMYASPLR